MISDGAQMEAIYGQRHNTITLIAPLGASGRVKKTRSQFFTVCQSNPQPSVKVENFPCVTGEFNGANLDISFAPLS